MRSLGPVVFGVALALAGCGGADPPLSTTSSETADDGAVATTQDTSAASEPVTAPSEARPPGEFGTFTVGGQDFAVTDVRRCQPFSDDPGNLDLQALAAGAQLNLPVNDGGATLDVSVQGPTVSANWGSISFAVDEGPVDFAVVDDRITGTATLADATGGDATVDIAFDVAIPEDIIQC